MRKNLKVIAGGIRLIEGLAPGFLPCCVLQACMTALSPFINIYLSAALVNGLLAGWDMARLLEGVLLMAVLNLVCGGVGGWVGGVGDVEPKRVFPP